MEIIRQHAQPARGARRAPPWRIVAYHNGGPAEDEPPRFAVLRGERRVVWGLRDHQAATRWLLRLNQPV